MAFALEVRGKGPGKGCRTSGLCRRQSVGEVVVKLVESDALRRDDGRVRVELRRRRDLPRARIVHLHAPALCRKNPVAHLRHAVAQRAGAQRACESPGKRRHGAPCCAAMPNARQKMEGHSMHSTVRRTTGGA